MPRFSLSPLRSRLWLGVALAAMLVACGQTGRLFLRIPARDLPYAPPPRVLNTPPILVPVGGTLVAAVVSTTNPPAAVTVMSPSGLTLYIPVPATVTNAAPAVATHR